MPFHKKTQKFNAKINTVTIGTGNRTVTFGGSNTFPFYSFDAPTEHTAKVGIEICDGGSDTMPDCLKSYYEGCTCMADIAKRAIGFEGVDFLVLNLEGGDPNGENKTVEELLAVIKETADAVDFPLAVKGCDHIEKDEELLVKAAELLRGRNVLLLSAKEENYQAIAKGAGLAYGQLVGAESSVDINLAKQLNVVTTQSGVSEQKIVMNLGSAAVGYGYEYLVSTLDRVKIAALGQNDNMLQMPVILPVACETWNVKESTATQEDMPEWGPVQERGIAMEITTAAANLAAGADAVILRHPESVSTISAMIRELA
ncbi:MAG: acetyl-CoA decarbonylase/synthase complex subunit delta [Blautia sp.]|nr:acetyl-CoA decarbonylase/synthase complex subunit delta [Blautia sp.]